MVKWNAWPSRSGKPKSNIKKYANNDCIANDEKNAIEKARAAPPCTRSRRRKKAQERSRILDAARKQCGSAQDKLDASSRFNKARFALEKMEHDAVTASESLSQDRRLLFDAQHEIKRINESLVKAVGWRDELLEALRTTFSLRGPHLKGDDRSDLVAHLEGTKGTLPKITVAKIVDAFTCHRRLRTDQLCR